MRTSLRKQILLLGIENRLLWQLTRILSFLEDQVEYHSLEDLSEAKELCAKTTIDLIIVNEWEAALQAESHLADEKTFDQGPFKWVVLVDTIPLECMPDGRIYDSVVFLEKPFNPKETASFLLWVLNDQKEAAKGAPVAAEMTDYGVPLVPDEKYEPPEETKEALPTLPPPKPSSAGQEAEKNATTMDDNNFHCLLDMGFACSRLKDWDGARKHWTEALEIRPHDQRLQINLKRVNRILQRTA